MVGGWVGGGWWSTLAGRCRQSAPTHPSTSTHPPTLPSTHPHTHTHTHHTHIHPHHPHPRTPPTPNNPTHSPTHPPSSREVSRPLRLSRFCLNDCSCSLA